jgi:hypothetical protein
VDAPFFFATITTQKNLYHPQMRIVFYRKTENNSNNRNNIVFVTYHVGTRRVALLDLAFPLQKRGTPRPYM